VSESRSCRGFGAVLSLVHSGVEVDKRSPSTFRRPCWQRKSPAAFCRLQLRRQSVYGSSTIHTGMFTTHSALHPDLQTYIPAKKIMIYCQKVGRLRPIRAVPPLKVHGTARAVPRR